MKKLEKEKMAQGQVFGSSKDECRAYVKAHLGEWMKHLPIFSVVGFMVLSICQGKIIFGSNCSAANRK